MSSSYNDLWKTAPERANGHIRGSMPLITETRQGFESVPKMEIQALPLTRPSLMSSVITSSPHSTSSCSRSTCHFTRAHWATRSSMSSRSTTTAVWSRPQAMSMPHTTSGGILLEYDMVTLPELARMIANQYKGRLAILYDRVLRHRKMTMDKSNTLWNINLNVPARSM